MEQSIIGWDDFMRVEMRVGTIIEAEVFKEARKPSYKMLIDFGAFGKRRTSAQITRLYQPETLIGRQVIAVVNFPPKQIANFFSECLVMGAVAEDGTVTLLSPERPIANGERIG